MAPLQTPFSALRSLTRLSPLNRPFPRQSQLPRLHAKHQHLPLPLTRCPLPRSYSTSSPPSPRPHTSSHKPRAPRPSPQQPHQIPVPPPKPEYEMTFTCTPCSTRSTHRVSKQGYHKGSVLITCPECKNRHVISDHLGIFGDRKLTIEDLMREQGQLVKRGTLSEDGNLEFWADGSTTTRVKERGQSVDGEKEEKGDGGA
ncbi:DNL zinc finger-domain-containing protein [Cadophora sp. MPI-SDFR-AT-0126]|nr:DNL zinc finger-domain-containing protein [Leotiomycetes sp. MPI-SDFR-AT-0126]